MLENSLRGLGDGLLEAMLAEEMRKFILALRAQSRRCEGRYDRGAGNEDEEPE